MKKTFFTSLFILTIINCGFSQNESIKSLIEKTNEMNLDMWDLSDFVQKHLEEKEELAIFFYYWIGANIQYDYQTFREVNEGGISIKEFLKRQNKFQVYENRKGVCAGYSNLFQWFMDDVGIETVIISGHIRDQRNHYVNLTDDNFRHAWNAIKLDGKWRLVDTTWGTSNDPNQSEFYYDINPEWLIITHFPEDSKWQLLEKPLTLEEFNNSIFVKPVWFYHGFSEIPKLMSDDNYYYFVFKDVETNWSVNLQYSLDNINFDYIRGIEPITQDGMVYYRFEKEQIAEKAFFKVGLTLLIKEEKGYSTIQYTDVINFKM